MSSLPERIEAAEGPHHRDCPCLECQRLWEEWEQEQQENERREAENREMERFYRDNPHG